MTAYALFHGWVQDEIDGIQINGKNYSTSQILTLETDNAALTARVNFLERLVKEQETQITNGEALETQLAAARKALEAIAGYNDQGHEKWRQDHPGLSQLIGHPGVFSDSRKINVLCQFARAALEAKP